jgi:hypothetical protein
MSFFELAECGLRINLVVQFHDILAIPQRDDLGCWRGPGEEGGKRNKSSSCRRLSLFPPLSTRHIVVNMVLFITRWDL